MLAITVALALAVGGDDPAAKPAPRPADKRICRTKPNTGTRFPTKTCRTAAQWEQLAEQNRRDAEETINRPAINPPGD